MLKEIRSTADLKALSLDELHHLAAELRQVIADTVAINGGHLAPNLGTVELTLALHTIFDSPRDKILWDVSHQSYSHKLLTGRFERFHTLRQYQGVAGFTHPEESEHDHFHWGHASTSISAAVGMAKARDLRGENFDVVSIIGDGALTGGMAYEALNHAGHDKTRQIVVLNDNSMSIAPNVGGISQFLSRVRTGPAYHEIKKQAAELIKRLPLLGPQIFELTDKGKESLKTLFLPTMLFEDLGWTYIGPVDGHNIRALQDALRDARSSGGPAIVHVVTVKGKGIPFAEKFPDKYHGGGPFNKETGAFTAGSVTYSDIFSNTLVRLAGTDERVVGITAAMPGGTGLSKLASSMKERYFDVGIAEQHAVSMAAGMAKQGMRPVVAVYSTFLQRGYDQVIHDVCVQNLPVVFAIDRAGLVEDGATHQGVFDIAYLRCLPNMVVGAPKDENELQHMLFTGIGHQGGPFAFRYPRSTVQGVLLEPELHELPIGQAEVLREGQDVTILALGVWAPVACRAAAELAAEGIQAWVVNPRWVKPLDVELISRLARQTGAVLTVEEAALCGGFGAAVTECLADGGLAGVHVQRLGVPDRFVPHGKPVHFLEQFGLSQGGICRAARELVNRTRSSKMAVPVLAKAVGEGVRG